MPVPVPRWALPRWALGGRAYVPFSGAKCSPLLSASSSRKITWWAELSSGCSNMLSGKKPHLTQITAAPWFPDKQDRVTAVAAFSLSWGMP